MTIYALSTGSVKSGIAIIRISGIQVENILSQLTNKNLPKYKEATIRKIYDPSTKELIDQGMIILFKAPNSYTGEDLAEIHVHGSKAVITTLLSSLSKFEDCRMAEPGEFTKLALNNGKMNLLEVEALSDLIDSETEHQRMQALKLLNGEGSKRYIKLRHRLLKILANIEAKIDFPEEDLPEDILNNIQIETQKIIKDIRIILDDNRVGEKIREGFKVAIIGPTNAGKSSFLNYLSKREAAIVSDIEGTTRDVIEVNLNLGGLPVLLFDTAGLRQTDNPIEEKGVQLAISIAKRSDLKIIILEAKNPHFSTLIDQFRDAQSILVINKSDLLDKNKIKMKSIIKDDHFLISVKEDKGLNVLIEEIKNRLKEKFVINDNTLITRERHRDNLEKCVEYLEIFLTKNSLEEFDKAGEDLRLATRHLGKVLGEVDVEEVLGKIFDDFCIGK